MKEQEAFRGATEPSPYVLGILQLAAATAQREHRPTFGSHDVLLELIRQNNSVLGSLFKTHRPQRVNMFFFGKKLEQAVHTIAMEHATTLAVRPAAEHIHVQRLAQQFAHIERVKQYTEKHLIKALLISDDNPQINAAFSEAGINRKGLAQQIK